MMTPGKLECMESSDGLVNGGKTNEMAMSCENGGDSTSSSNSDAAYSHCKNSVRDYKVSLHGYRKWGGGSNSHLSSSPPHTDASDATDGSPQKNSESVMAQPQRLQSPISGNGGTLGKAVCEVKPFSCKPTLRQYRPMPCKSRVVPSSIPSAGPRPVAPSVSTIHVTNSAAAPLRKVATTVRNHPVSTKIVPRSLPRRCNSEPNFSKLFETQSLTRSNSFPSLTSKQSQRANGTETYTRTTVDRRPPVSVISYGQPQLSRIVAPKATFVEMTHAEFMKRQLMLNEKVNIRQGFRVGNQIYCMPDLVSCSTPKNNAPILVQSTIQQARTVPNVVVSQTATSHTIHYTPALTHAQPNWQNEIRKKPIIAYARRKVNDKPISAKENVITVASETSVPSNTHSTIHSKTFENGNSSDDEVVFIKTTADKRQYTPAMKREDVEPAPKQTLPKFNQTFVHNYQMKPAVAESVEHDAFTARSFSHDPYDDDPPSTEEVSADDAATPTPAPKSTTVPSPTHTHLPSTVIQSPIGRAAGHIPVVTHTSQTSSTTTTTGVIQPTPNITGTTTATSAPHSVLVERPVQMKSSAHSSSTQVGLLIYAGAGSEETQQPVHTLLLTTLSNGSAYCLRLAQPNSQTGSTITPITSSSSANNVQHVPRPLLVQTVPITSPVIPKPRETMPSVAPVESNKVALMKDIREFENVFEETKLKFEKEKQLTGGEIGCVVDNSSCSPPSATVTTPPPLPPTSPPPPLPTHSSLTIPISSSVLPKLDCERLVVGVKRKADCADIPLVTRLFASAKKPLLVVTNYGQATTLPTRLGPVSPIPLTVTAPKSPKGKHRVANPAKSPPVPKPQHKPHEDEQTQQKIFAILEEYAVQKEHSPDTNNRPAPRRRSNGAPGCSTATGGNAAVVVSTSVVPSNNPSFSESSPVLSKTKKRPVAKFKDASSGDSEDSSFPEI